MDTKVFSLAVLHGAGLGLSSLVFEVVSVIFEVLELVETSLLYVFSLVPGVGLDLLGVHALVGINH